MKIITVILSVLCILTGISPWAIADHSDSFRFHYATRIGNVITGAIQDKDGFIWISGRGGLRRYDGYEMKLYQKSSHNLSDNWTNCVLEDRSGFLWVGTRTGGLNVYSKDTDSFNVFKNGKSGISSLDAGFITCLYEDFQGTVWIGTQKNGLHCFTPDSGAVNSYIYKPENINSLTSNHILSLKEDKQGVLWIGTMQGLNSMELSLGRIEHYPEFSGKGVNSIAVDEYDNLWIGTLGHGLYKYERSTNTFCSYEHDPADKSSLAGNLILDLFFDSHGTLWVAHFHKGISIYDLNEDKFTRISAGSETKFSIRSNDVKRIIEDRSHNIWIFCVSGEIEKYDPKSKGFIHYRHEPDNPDSISSNVVLPIIEDNNKTIWIGTGNGGLNRFDRTSGTFAAYKPVAGDLHSLKHLTVLGLHEDSLGNLWLATTDLTSTALSLFDKQNGRVMQHYVHDPVNPFSLGKGTMVREILQDNKEPYTLWISIDGFGIDRMDIKTGKFFHEYALKAVSKGINPEFRIWDLYQDNEQVLWMATEGAGLARLDTQKNEYMFYRHEPDNPQSIASDTVFALHHDKNNIFWLATDNGMDRFDPETVKFKHFTKAHGLSDNAVYGIQEDKSGNLWISTNNGLNRFNPQNGSFRIYTMSDGLQADAFFNRSYGQTKDGEMWFGGLNGVNRFMPEDIGENEYAPPIVITSLTQGGEPVLTGKDSTRIKSVSLNWQHNYFEFEYAGLEFTRPGKNRYKYILHGMDKDWFDAGTRRFGRYTGIPVGDYILQVIGSNNDGRWNDKGASLEIKVIPPFWRASWFIFVVILVCFLAGLMIFLYMARLKEEIFLRRKAEKNVRKELEQRKQLEKERKSMEAKLHRAQRMEALGTLAGGIAHDFNNLLMGIQGRASLMRFKIKADHPNNTHLREIEKCVVTASDLTGRLLGFARGGKYEIKTTDINKFIKETAEMFGRTRKEITIYYNLDKDTRTIDVDQTQLNQVLLNLFVNAWQAMPGGGELFLETKNTVLDYDTVSPYSLNPGHYVQISVSDTGTGIAKKNIDRIFDPFFTTKEQGRGTGLGLASAYGIIRNHEGFISVYSEIGSGTRFNIYLPGSGRAADEYKKQENDLIKGSETILLVDDEPMILEVGAQLLEHLGYKVITASGGKEAVKTYQSEKEKISLVILDLIMPGMSGAQTFEQLKKINPDARVILSSGYGLNGQAAKVMEQGCSGFIQKPFNISRLGKKIREVLD